MIKEKFSFFETGVAGAVSGLRLQMVDNEINSENLPWIEAWFDLPTGHCVTQKFLVEDTGLPTYEGINEALIFWGAEVLGATVNSTQMSPEFATRYLYKAIMQRHQSRWN